MLKILIAAGIGGTLPTLCRLAATYSVSENAPPPAIGLYIALGLFFVIGMAVAFGFDESNLKKAFILGIAGPAIVTSTFTAVSEAKTAEPQVPASTSPPVTSGSGSASMARLFGISDAQAQVTQGATRPSNQLPGQLPGQQPGQQPGQVPGQLTISTNLSGTGAGYSSAPIELQFKSPDGVVVGSTAVSPKLDSTVQVPAGASSIDAFINGKTTSAKLPEDAFESARLNVNIMATRTNDFLWALGSNKRATVQAVSASVDNVVRPATAVEKPSELPQEPVKAGTPVYSKSGMEIGVVEAVKPDAAGKQPRILVRGNESMIEKM
ncbi:MAG TPA: hypothetical protein VGN07_09660 [Steroidobacteraceae bacterium]